MIHIHNVSFSYESRKEDHGIHGIELHIPKGQCVLLTGKSGCGKTTLTRLINGLIPGFYTGRLSGEISIGGRLLEKWRTDELYAIVGSVFQNPRSQFFNLDTTSEIAFGCENLGLDRKEIHRRVHRTFEELQITGLADRNIFSLSGGEKQMIAIASAYAMGPDIFVMDEPSANLDAPATQQLAQLISRLKAAGKTIVIAEHRVYYLHGIADRVLYMQNGHIAHDWMAAQFSRLTEEERLEKGLRSISLEKLQPGCRLQSVPLESSRGFQVENLSVCYKRGTPVLKSVTCEAHEGESIAVIGRNGHGKTTLARCLCGLLKENGGSVLHLGKRMHYKDRAGKIYLVMQESGYQLFSESVEQEMSLPLKDTDAPREDLKNWALEMMSLDPFRDRHPMTLSGGEKQRLAIAAGILQNSAVMILDEPTSGLDYTNMQRVMEAIYFMKKMKKRIFIITHDYEFLLSACDRVLHIDEGRLLEDYRINRENLPKLQQFFIQAPGTV